MKTKIKIILSALSTLYIGWQMDSLIGNFLYSFSKNIMLSVFAALVLFIACYFVIGYICGAGEKFLSLYRSKVETIDIIGLFIKVGCILLGLSLGALISIPFISYGKAGAIIALFINVATISCTYLFSSIKGQEIRSMISMTAVSRRNTAGDDSVMRNNLVEIIESLTGNMDRKKFNTSGIPKILDTSVIIDGRIYDLCKSGFIEGELIIPSVVLEELRHIADSSDTLKRNRGRRGLDVLKNIQASVPVKIEEVHMTEGMEVDSVLLKLAKKMNAKVITNDYNLNKVAAVQEVEIFNINELANAIKPILLPGEEMQVRVMKDGKENGQGIAYLEDGTMIVVEGGKYLIGKELPVIVTSVLQTAAGRMIFAKPKEQEQVS